MDLDSAARKLEALGNPSRLALLRLLVRAGPEGLSVGDCRSRLGLAGSTLSFHIKALAGVGLMTQERRSRTLICRADFAAMEALIGFLMAECCVESGRAGPLPPLCA